MRELRLEPYFTREAAGQPHRRLDGHGSASESGSDTSAESAKGMDSLTLEFTDNPLASFLRHIDRLIDIDPAEAYRQTKQVLSSKAFGDTPDSRLLSKFDEVIEKMQETRPDNHFGLSTGPDFMQAAYHTRPYRQEDRFAKAAPDTGLKREISPFEEELRRNALRPRSLDLFG